MKNALKPICAVVVLYLATAITAPAQETVDFTTLLSFDYSNRLGPRSGAGPGHRREFVRNDSLRRRQKARLWQCV